MPPPLPVQRQKKRSAFTPPGGCLRRRSVEVLAPLVAADIAALSRIVTLHNLSISPDGKSTGGDLSMEALARTYRYLDPAEVVEARKAVGPGKDKK